MPKDFSDAAHWAKEHISVPALDIQGIAERSRRATAVDRLRLSGVTALVVLLIAATGTGFAQRAFDGIRIWLSGQTAAVRIESMATLHYPTSSEFRSIAARTVVPFVYPVGLPASMKIWAMAFWPMNRPDTVMLIYANGNGGLQSFTIVANSAVAQGAPPTPNLGGPVTRWSVANEQVIARADPAHPQTSAAIQTVRAAMQNVTPAASVLQNLARTHRIIILGGFPKAALEAEALARGNAVLIDRGHLAEIPALAAAKQPLLISRTAELTNIPQQNGAPDYAHATYTWQKTVALSAQAVRLVNGALSAHGGLTKCACEILYDEQPDGQARLTVLPAR
ncbi:MAG TPA: hypothetical protein VFE17_07895 [Candidatus Baltobacteraceae bacterium]|jgi:hypothetical protein|nr:hypothetical protein [Candidatus Baltobacteraceae bacterium]